MGLASFTPVYTTQQDFILEDGTINPNSYDRLGNVRAATAFPNAIGFNSVSPDRDDAVFLENGRFGAFNVQGRALLTQVGTNFALTDAYQSSPGVWNPSWYFSNDAQGATTGESDYSKEWFGFDDGFAGLGSSANIGMFTINEGFYADNASQSVGAFTADGSYNITPTSARYIQRIDGVSTSVIGHDKSRGYSEAHIGINIDSYSTLYGALWTADNRLADRTNPGSVGAVPVSLASHNSTHRAGIRGSTGLTGGGLDINKNNYAFAENIEVQGGLVNLLAESKIVFDSSGTNKTVIEDSNSDNQLEFDTSYLLLYKNTGTISSEIFIDDAVTQMAYRDSADSIGTSYTQVVASNVTFNASNNRAFYASVSQTNGPEIYSEDNVNAYTTTGGNRYPVVISSRNTTVNAGRTNSVAAGGVGLVIDQDDTLFAQELRIRSGVNNIILSDSSDATFQFYKDSNEFWIDNNNGLFTEQLFYMNKTTNEISINTGFGVTGGSAMGAIGSGNTGRSYWIMYNAAGQGTNSLECLYNTGIQRASTNGTRDRFPVLVATKNGIVRSNIIDSVSLGGDGVDINKSGYAFAQNLEVQGGIAAYTVDPTTQGVLWNDRAIPDKAYVDAQVGGITSAQDWSGIIGGSTDRATDFSGSYTLADLANNFFTLVADLRAAGILQ